MGGGVRQERLDARSQSRARPRCRALSGHVVCLGTFGLSTRDSWRTILILDLPYCSPLGPPFSHSAMVRLDLVSSSLGYISCLPRSRRLCPYGHRLISLLGDQIVHPYPIGKHNRHYDPRSRRRRYAPRLAPGTRYCRAYLPPLLLPHYSPFSPLSPPTTTSRSTPGSLSRG